TPITAAPATTTTSAPATTTTTVPSPLFSFDGSVPAPDLVNSGTDYEAIYRSLDAYAQWINAHHPHPAAVDEIYVEGTPLYDAAVSDMHKLLQYRYRWYRTASVLTTVEVVGATSDLVVLRVNYAQDRTVVVRSDGGVSDDQQLPASSTRTVTLRLDEKGHWRIESSEGDAEIHLRQT
ncbi:MAG TPA: hypothetical protein VFX21_16855, partial [Acidimicrobiia bacterium]|nr:hypothetical protein [Acidimicrobiia bacterium]